MTDELSIGDLLTWVSNHSVGYPKGQHILILSERTVGEDFVGPFWCYQALFIQDGKAWLEELKLDPSVFRDLILVQRT